MLNVEVIVFIGWQLLRKGKKQVQTFDNIVIIYSTIIFLFFIAAGVITVELLSVEEEILKIMELCLEQLKIEGIYIPLWSRLGNLYDVPRKQVDRVVQLIKENVFVSKAHLRLCYLDIIIRAIEFKTK